MGECSDYMGAENFLQFQLLQKILKHMKNIFTFLFFLFAMTLVNAQEIGYGFKAGLNFSSIQGESEMDDAGMDLESFKNNTGFQIGGIINFKIVDAFGIRTEILFSQKGGRYNYNGQGYQRLFFTNGDAFLAEGTKEIDLNITNAYIDIPVMGYVKVNKWLELSAGANIGFLVASSAAGELRYAGNTSAGVEEFVVSLDYKYFSDTPGEAKLLVDEPILREVMNQFLEIPRGFGAYYDLDEGDETGLYKTIDLGVLAGINIYLNQGLSLGARLNYGLVDITKNDLDRSLFKLNDGQFIFRDDMDRNISLQTSLTFSF